MDQDVHAIEKGEKENIVYSEIFKLDEMLTKAGIPHDFVDESTFVAPFYHIYFPSEKAWHSEAERAHGLCCSAIEGHGSYGEERNRIEIMGLLTEEEEEDSSVLGYLTAEDVFGRMKTAYEQRLNEKKKGG